MRAIIGLLVAWFTAFSMAAQTEKPISPMDIPLLLSGNFGELRSNHFHSGVDFKTQGRTGIAVKSVWEGYISRIGVSPYGYGRVVYIDHPNGLTSVYAHLDRFSSKIQEAVIDSMYQREAFQMNLFFSPEDFPLKQGDVFAYSGNTGSSGGPHVHFEFRETETERPIDPLPYYKDKIKDTRSPDIQGIMLFPINEEGIINGKVSKQTVPLVAKKGTNTTPTAWGKIGIGVKAYDKMDNVNNIFGVYEIILYLDGEEIYHSLMDGFSFDDTRYLNTYVDWEEWIENKSFYMKSFTDPGNYLGINRHISNGVIDIEEERLYNFEYVLKDVYGNMSRRSFSVQGKESAIPQKQDKEVCFAYNKNNIYEDKGIELDIPRRRLYTTECMDIDTVSGYTAYAPLYKLGARLPLHTYCPINLAITSDLYPDSSKYGIVQIYKDKKTWLGGEYKNGKVMGRIRELGSFSVMIDNTPPVISPVGEAKWKINKKISFKITDDLSGIKTYKGTLDGDFIPFELDAKRNSLFYVYDPKRVPSGSYNLELIVTDGAGNSRTYTSNVRF